MLPLAIVRWLAAVRAELTLYALGLRIGIPEKLRQVTSIVLSVGLLLGTGLSLLPNHAGWQGSVIGEIESIRNWDVEIPRRLRETCSNDELVFSPNMLIDIDYDQLPLLCVSEGPVSQVNSPSQLINHPRLQAATRNGFDHPIRLVVNLRACFQMARS